jgi:hypothetical protein
MKPNELRIGNWVEIQGLESKIISVDTEGCICENEYCEDFENNNITQNLQPIPLTEEWLERFGFEYSDLNGDSGLWKIPPFQIYGKCNQFIYEYALDVNYVHQLQNLYFALTGEELNQNKDANSTDNFNSNSIPSV